MDHKNVKNVVGGGIYNSQVKKLKVMSKEEIKEWIDRWSKLKPSKRRDVVIKIWSRLLK
jgi:hypothetical protein